MGVLISVLVEPGEGLAVLVPEPGRDPHDRGSPGPSGIGQQLAEVAVIGIAQLVFHDEDDAVGLVLADDVEGAAADGMGAG